MEKYNVVIELTTEMLGTVAANKEVFEKFILQKKRDEMEKNEKKGKPLTFEPTEADLQAEIETIQEVEENGYTVFMADKEKGLFLYDYLVKGFIRYAGNALKDIVETGKKEPGIAALKSKLTDFCFVFPRMIFLNKQEPDGVRERPLRANTAKGPRNSLARSDKVNAGLRIHFQIGLLPHKEVSWAVIRQILEYGELQGLGQWRNGGYGRFKLVSFEPEK